MRTIILILCFFIFSEATSQQYFNETPKSDSKGELERERIFILSDKMATYPGGPNAWTKYLQKNLDYSLPKKNNAPPGKYNVIVMFVIDQKGNVSEIKSLTKHGYGMEDEAIRVIEKGPRWSPAVDDGKPVRSYRKQPLTFYVRSD